jgi:vanillate O-demethylase ferredoxin subunit
VLFRSEQLLPGTALQVSAPRNLFALQDAPHALLLAGGIGITPLLCMARQLHAASASFALHYCGRSLSRMAFVEPLRSSTWADAVHLHCDDGDARQRLNAEALLLGAAADTHLYVCGPKGFMDHVLGTARGLGWPESRLHFESFSAQADASGDAFTLRLAKRNREIAVPSGVTALEALLAAGIDVPISCEQGVCGTCALPVLSGMPDHRDVYFTEAERAKSPMFTPCCSRSHSAVLELDY